MRCFIYSSQDVLKSKLDEKNFIADIPFDPNFKRINFYLWPLLKEYFKFFFFKLDATTNKKKLEVTSVLKGYVVNIYNHFIIIEWGFHNFQELTSTSPKRFMDPSKPSTNHVRFSDDSQNYRISQYDLRYPIHKNFFTRFKESDFYQKQPKSNGFFFRFFYVIPVEVSDFNDKFSAELFSITSDNILYFNFYFPALPKFAVEFPLLFAFLKLKFLIYSFIFTYSDIKYYLYSLSILESIFLRVQVILDKALIATFDSCFVVFNFKAHKQLLGQYQKISSVYLQFLFFLSSFLVFFLVFFSFFYINKLGSFYTEFLYLNFGIFDPAYFDNVDLTNNILIFRYYVRKIFLTFYFVSFLSIIFFFTIEKISYTFFNFYWKKVFSKFHPFWGWFLNFLNELFEKLFLVFPSILLFFFFLFNSDPSSNSYFCNVIILSFSVYLIFITFLFFSNFVSVLFLYLTGNLSKKYFLVERAKKFFYFGPFLLGFLFFYFILSFFIFSVLAFFNYIRLFFPSTAVK